MCRFFPGLRFHIALVLFALALSIAGLFLYAFRQDVRHAERSAGHDALSIARTIARTQDERTETVRQLFVAIAGRADVSASEPDAAAAAFAEILAPHLPCTTLMLMSADGDARASAGVRLDESDRDVVAVFEAARDGMRFVAGPHRWDCTSGTSRTLVGLPVHDPTGALRHVLLASVTSTWKPFTPDAKLVFTGDAGGGFLDGMARGRREGMEQLTDEDGTTRAYGFAAMGDPAALKHVAVGLPVASRIAPVRGAFYRNLGVLCGAAMLAMLFAWCVSERLVFARIRALAGTVKKFGSGRLDQRSSVTGNDEISGLQSGFNDMSERIVRMLRAEAVARQELTVLNQQMHTLLNILPEGVALLDATGRVVLSNPVARAALDADNGLMTGVDLASRVQHPDLVQEFETACDGRVFDHALARATAAGPLVWVFRELTERRRLMAQVLHRSKMADLGLLAAGIAHEIGNPLSSMSAILQVLEHRKTAPEAMGRLQALDAHIGRIDKIVHQITDFARPSEEVPTRLSTRSILQKAADIFHLHARSHETELRLPAPEVSFEIDAIEDQMLQVLLNLLLNAADSMEDDGAIEIKVARAGGEVRISIIDTGRGMSPETRMRLFTSFFTTKTAGKGVGLGLFVSESIVRAHGGRIDVRSEKGRGSTFTVCLPEPAGAR